MLRRARRRALWRVRRELRLRRRSESMRGLHERGRGAGPIGESLLGRLDRRPRRPRALRSVLQPEAVALAGGVGVAEGIRLARRPEREHGPRRRGGDLGGHRRGRRSPRRRPGSAEAAVSQVGADETQDHRRRDADRLVDGHGPPPRALPGGLFEVHERVRHLRLLLLRRRVVPVPLPMELLSQVGLRDRRSRPRAAPRGGAVLAPAASPRQARHRGRPP
mmetsp:Transcript_2284/g.7673  ORF Transcript_2284/g.7673 Transcript_2284/m.7673 type:complete len:220 (+) Transcript_2284:3941-4600(+)